MNEKQYTYCKVSSTELYIYSGVQYLASLEFNSINDIKMLGDMAYVVDYEFGSRGSDHWKLYEVKNVGAKVILEQQHYFEITVVNEQDLIVTTQDHKYKKVGEYLVQV